MNTSNGPHAWFLYFKLSLTPSRQAFACQSSTTGIVLPQVMIFTSMNSYESAVLHEHEHMLTGHLLVMMVGTNSIWLCIFWGSTNAMVFSVWMWGTHSSKCSMIETISFNLFPFFSWTQRTACIIWDTSVLLSWYTNQCLYMLLNPAI